LPYSVLSYVAPQQSVLFLTIALVSQLVKSYKRCYKFIDKLVTSFYTDDDNKLITGIMNKPKGGRGRKANYTTKIVRLPEIAAIYANLIGDNARDLIEAGEDELELYFCSLEKNQAINVANQILSKKLSARQSLEKLLQVLYQQEIKLQPDKNKPVTSKEKPNL
jgi:hypothetical protein